MEHNTFAMDASSASAATAALPYAAADRADSNSTSMPAQRSLIGVVDAYPAGSTGRERRPDSYDVGRQRIQRGVFDNARSSVDNVLGADGNGWKAAMTSLGHRCATSVPLSVLPSRNESAAGTRLPPLRIRGPGAAPRTDRLLYRAALPDGEFGPEASIGMYYCSKRHQQFTEVAMDVLGLDALLGTVWGTRIACDIDARLFSPAR